VRPQEFYGYRSIDSDDGRFKRELEAFVAA